MNKYIVFLNTLQGERTIRLYYTGILRFVELIYWFRKFSDFYSTLDWLVQTLEIFISVSRRVNFIDHYWD